MTSISAPAFGFFWANAGAADAIDTIRNNESARRSAVVWICLFVTG
jgi:hypothetical protein